MNSGTLTFETCLVGKRIWVIIWVNIGDAWYQLANVQGRARSAMDALPPAVLMAVIAPTVLATGLAETIAAAVTVLAAFRLPLLVAVAIGVASVVALRALIG